MLGQPRNKGKRRIRIKSDVRCRVWKQRGRREAERTQTYSGKNTYLQAPLILRGREYRYTDMVVKGNISWQAVTKLSLTKKTRSYVSFFCSLGFLLFVNIYERSTLKLMLHIVEWQTCKTNNNNKESRAVYLSRSVVIDTWTRPTTDGGNPSVNKR